jgi:hypothetical protein
MDRERAPMTTQARCAWSSRCQLPRWLGSIFSELNLSWHRFFHQSETPADDRVRELKVTAT